MEKYVPVLKETQLFAGVRADEVNTILGCFQAKSRIYNPKPGKRRLETFDFG